MGLGLTCYTLLEVRKRAVVSAVLSGINPKFISFCAETAHATAQRDFKRWLAHRNLSRGIKMGSSSLLTLGLHFRLVRALTVHSALPRSCASYPSCAAVCPRDSRSRCVLCAPRRSLGVGGSLIPSAPFASRLSRFPARCCVKEYETILFRKKETPACAGGNRILLRPEQRCSRLRARSGSGRVGLGKI